MYNFSDRIRFTSVNGHMKPLLFGFLFLLSSSIFQAQHFKTIGYLPYYRFGHFEDIDLTKVTHVNIAFANPDMQGNLSVGDQDIFPIVQALHSFGIEVYLSLAGGALTTEWAAAWKHLTKPQNRSAFIHQMMIYANNHQLQGIDVDLEWSHVDENYSGFVLELRDSVNQHGLGLTAALPGTYRYPEISDACLAAYDWINMMAYDLTGPWAPNHPGPHSPFSFAVNATVHWINQGVATDQLMLGLPFYGYDFTDQNNVIGLTYRTIVGVDPDNAYRDQDGQIYYNGIPTIRQKTEYALAQLGGVMVWELGQDHFGQYSLLDQIHDVIQSSVSSSIDLANGSIEVFPNPFDVEINLRSEGPLEGAIQIIDIHGKEVFSAQMMSTEEQFFLPESLLPGMYTLIYRSEDLFFAKKLVRQE